MNGAEQVVSEDSDRYTPCRLLVCTFWARVILFPLIFRRDRCKNVESERSPAVPELVFR